MTRAGRLRFLGFGVAGAAAILVAAARYGGGPAARGSAASGGGRSGDLAAAQASAGGGDPADLSFYTTLGKAPARGGRSAAPADRLVRPADEAPPPAGAYVVQAIATRDPAQARRVRDRLAVLGLAAVIVEGRAGVATIYRVRVGRYRDRPAAEGTARRLRSEPGLSPWVLQETE